MDRDLAVHGFDDLFVASSSTFVTSSQANSTFMIVAFALRLADRLRAEMLSRPPALRVATPARPLHVLMVTPRYLPEMGGVERHVSEVSQRMVERGCSVTILCTDLTGRLPAVEERDGVTVRRVPAWPGGRDYYFAPGIWHEISGRAWDVIHVPSYHTLTTPLAMLAALRLGVPYVVTFHGGGRSSRVRTSLRPTQRRLLRPLLARAARLVAAAPFEVDLYGRELSLPAERFTVIPNGAELDFELTSLPPGARATVL